MFNEGKLSKVLVCSVFSSPQSLKLPCRAVPRVPRVLIDKNRSLITLLLGQSKHMNLNLVNLPRLHVLMTDVSMCHLQLGSLIPDASSVTSQSF